MNKSFKEDFDLLKNKIVNDIPFGMCRFSDGELAILKGDKLELSERGTFINNVQCGPIYPKEDWKSFDISIPEHLDFQQQLIASLQHKQKNYIPAISCKCCVGFKDAKWMKELSGQKDEDLTWSNIWLNSNYHRFVTEIIPILRTKKLVFICNKYADFTNSTLPIIQRFNISRNAMINDINIWKDISVWISELDIRGHVFLFSASSLSNICIHNLYKLYPENTYIDVGTTLNHELGFRAVRSYLDAYWNGNPHPDLYKSCVW